MDTTKTTHSTERAVERMALAGLNPERVLTLAAQVAKATNEATAVRIITLPATVGDNRDDVLTRESNGNQVWAVIRDQRVVTLFMRRDHQPHDAASMRVDRVIALSFSGGKVRSAELK